MKKIYYFAPGRSFWAEVVKNLYEKGVAKPVLWIGDWRHDNFFKQEFVECNIINLKQTCRQPSQVEIYGYSGFGSDFLRSENYIGAKDRCLKMMDRLDELGCLSRVDRESLFNGMCIKSLAMIENNPPDCLVMGESPHSFVQYTVYEVCKYYGIPAVSFASLGGIVPALYLQYENSRTPLNKSIDLNLNEQIEEILLKIFKEYFQRIKAAWDYEPDYMRTQRLKSASTKRIISTKVLLKKMTQMVLGVHRKRGSQMLMSSHFDFAKEQELTFLEKRRSVLRQAYRNHIKGVDLNKPYVYFPLHYEPERTTTPDGGQFYDQFIALLSLREILPKDIKIYVKEHPSQFYSAMRGHQGRSPFFYKFIGDVDGVEFIPSDFSSIRLIDKSIFVGTITGTAGLEAIIRGRKALVFGNAWYRGCPNTYTWHEGFDFNEILHHSVEPTSVVYDYIVNLLKRYCILGLQNPSGLQLYSHIFDEKALSLERQGVEQLLESFLIGLGKKGTDT